MKKLLQAAKHGLLRSVPLLVAGGVALLSSSSFQHYVEKHPSVAVFVPALSWFLHSVNKARKPA